MIYDRIKTPLLLLMFLFSDLFSDTYTCQEHPYRLELREVGLEHVNHLIYLEKAILIKELKEGMWFIEKVTCREYGFDIIASHVQYGDETQQKFKLYVQDDKHYTLR